jgi:formylglycine-generating enzyme required for sulfatase activity
MPRALPTFSSTTPASYITWLSRITGKEYRLLTEAEWEYASRAGATTAYSWRDEIGKDNANCADCGSQWDKEQTAPVGSFKNAFGLYDMHRMSLEWVEDPWHESYEGAPLNGSAWLEGGDRIGRVVRRGPWLPDLQTFRATDRFVYSYDDRRSNIGFRLARTLNP